MIAVKMLLFDNKDLVKQFAELKKENEVSYIDTRKNYHSKKLQLISKGTTTVVKTHMTDFPHCPSTVKLSTLESNKDAILYKKKNLKRNRVGQDVLEHPRKIPRRVTP